MEMIDNYTPVKLGDCNTGDWVFHECGELAQVEEGKYGKYLCTGGFECHCSDKRLVYPLTLQNKVIAEAIHYFYDEMHREDLIHGSLWVNWLEDRLHEVMSYAKQEKYDECQNVYMVIREQIKSLKYHKSFL